MALRALALPAIGVAVLPKCPMCFMMILGALGLGHPHHEAVFALVQGGTLIVVTSLLVARRRRAPAQVVIGVAAAGAMLMVVAGLAPPELGWAGALLLALVWLVKPAGDAAPSCGCTAATMTPEVRA